MPARAQHCPVGLSAGAGMSPEPCCPRGRPLITRPCARELHCSLCSIVTNLPSPAGPWLLCQRAQAWSAATRRGGDEGRGAVRQSHCVSNDRQKGCLARGEPRAEDTAWTAPASKRGSGRTDAGNGEAELGGGGGGHRRQSPLSAHGRCGHNALCIEGRLQPQPGQSAGTGQQDSLDAELNYILSLEASRHGTKF